MQGINGNFYSPTTHNNIFQKVRISMLQTFEQTFHFKQQSAPSYNRLQVIADTVLKACEWVWGLEGRYTYIFTGHNIYINYSFLHGSTMKDILLRRHLI